MTRARVFDIAANGGTTLASTAEVPYAFVDPAAPTLTGNRSSSSTEAPFSMACSDIE